jgi:hypothetical protein
VSGPPCDKPLGPLDFHEILFDRLAELCDRAGVTSDAEELSLNLGLGTGNFLCVSSVYPCANQLVISNRMGRDSSVSIVTRYGLDGPGIESRRGREFSHLSTPALGPTQPPIQWVPDLSRG